MRDLGDDNTSKLIEDSRALRATLHALALSDPKPPPAVLSKREFLTGIPDGDPKLTAEQDVAIAVGAAVLEGLKQSNQVWMDQWGQTRLGNHLSIFLSFPGPSGQRFRMGQGGARQRPASDPRRDQSSDP